MNGTIDDKTYKEIKAYVLVKTAKVKDTSHNDEHAVRVKNNALKIIRILDLERQVDENLLKTICLLHDFTYTVRKPSMYTYIFEGHLERRVIRTVLKKFDLPDETNEIIIDAVFRHTHSFPFKRLNREHNVYTKVLQDADTLDFFDCLRVKIYIQEHDKGIFGNLKKKISYKFIEYGVNNLGSFLNYPILAKSFFTSNTLRCL